MLIGFFAWAIFVPKGDIGEKITETLKSQKKKADLFFRGVTFSEIVNGRKYWEIKAVSSDLNKTTQISNMKTVDATFFKKGKKSLKIIAPAATWNMKDKEIYLANPLGYDPKYERVFKKKIKGIDLEKDDISEFILPNSYDITKEIGFWFKAKNLTWKLATKRIICKKGIKLTKGDTVILSEHLEGDVGFERVILTGKPEATIEREEKIKLTATKFEVDSKSDIVYALGNVKLVLESTAEGTATINSNAASYNQKEKVIEFTGNIEIFIGDIRATSDLATYFMPQKKITLTGNPRASRAGDELRGEKIHIYIEENRIEVEGKTKIFISKSELED